MIFNYTQHKKKQTSKPLIYLLLVLLATLAFSQAYGQLTLNKHTINNGGGAMSGDGFEMIGSIGQVDAAPTLTEGHGAGNYSLSSGFWQENTDLIFKDNLE